MDGDGGNLQRLTNSSVSEASPVALPDGRILYTRWEYVDKGAVSVKCLWAMRPDGSASSEVYGNDIALPPTLIYGRPIPRQSERATRLAKVHKDVRLSPQELVQVATWVDTNARYYGTYWGHKNLSYKNLPDFRPTPSFGLARRMAAVGGP